MKILITGVAGLLGSNFADWILANREDIVVGVDSLEGGYVENVDKRVIFYERDLVHDDIESLFQKYKFDLVYHFAAYAAEGLSPFIRSFNYQNNLVASSRLISLSIKYNVKRFIFTSSMAVYGNAEAPFHEELVPKPFDPYGVAKYACEMDLKIAQDQHGLDFCILRPHNVYGPKQNIWDKYRNVLGIWMYQHLQNESMLIFGDGKQKRAFTYVADICKPLYLSGIKDEARNQIINLGGAKEYTIVESCDLLIRILGGGNKKHVTSRHEVCDAFTSWRKSVDILEYQDSKNLEEGLRKMWEWAKEQPCRRQKTWDSFELEKGLYESWRS